MEKSLEIRLSDNIKEVCELEATQLQLQCCLFVKKMQEKINRGANSIEISLKSGATVYGVNINNYYDKMIDIKSKYLNEIVYNIEKEYEFQFVNLQLELRELLANQKISLVNAKKCLDLKNVQTNKEFIIAYNNKKEKYLDKYYSYNSLVIDCKEKIQNCMKEAYNEIDRIIEQISETAISVRRENIFTKFINKVSNIFSGKSKFENKLVEFENKTNKLSLDSFSKVEKIKNDTYKLVSDILMKREELNA